VGAEARILASVSLVAILNVGTVFRKVPLMLAVMKPLDESWTDDTPVLAKMGFDKVNEIVLSAPVLNV
jgi:hypothetical protein